MCVCWRLEGLRGANFTPLYLHWPQETSSISIITSSWFKWDRRDRTASTDMQTRRDQSTEDAF